MIVPQRSLRPTFAIAALGVCWLTACTLTSDVNSLSSRPEAGSGGQPQGGTGGSSTQGSGGTGGSQGGSGGAGGGGQGFVRFANLMPIFDVEPQPEPLPGPDSAPLSPFSFFDLCVRTSESEPWQGPLLAIAGAPPFGPSQLSDHVPFAAGPFFAKALPDAVPDCEGPGLAEMQGEVREGEYQTLAVVGGISGIARFASYPDGRPSEVDDGLVEVSFANALGEAGFVLNVEPMGLKIDAFGVQQERVEPGVMSIEVYAADQPGELGFTTTEPVPIVPPFGHSIFFFISSTTIGFPSAFLCRNGRGASVSPQPQPSGSCSRFDLVPAGTPTPLPLPVP